MTRVFCPWIACIHNEGVEGDWDSGRCQQNNIRLEVVNDEELNCVNLQLLTKNNVVRILDSLIADRKTFIDEYTEPDDVFKLDIKALEEAIRIIRRGGE